MPTQRSASHGDFTGRERDRLHRQRVEEVKAREGEITLARQAEQEAVTNEVRS